VSSKTLEVQVGAGGKDRAPMKPHKNDEAKLEERERRRKMLLHYASFEAHKRYMARLKAKGDPWALRAASPLTAKWLKLP
jgi:hypothetical protein